MEDGGAVTPPVSGFKRMKIQKSNITAKILQNVLEISLVFLYNNIYIFTMYCYQISISILAHSCSVFQLRQKEYLWTVNGNRMSICSP